MRQKSINPYKNSDSNKRYYTYDYYLRSVYGTKCSKVPLDAGFSCPNIDGSKGTGGCTFCSGKGSGDFCASATLPIKEQFDAVKGLCEKKWKNLKYIPYFQAHSNTYAPTEVIKEKVEEALTLDNTVGIAIATRADCLSDSTVEYLRDVAKRTTLTVELGLQSVFDETAKRINRCHSYEEFLEGYQKLKGIDTCIHIINGLPGENKDMMMETARAVARLNPKFIKIHILHLIRGTVMAEQFKRGEFTMQTREEYVDTVCSQLEILPPDMVVERLTGDTAADILIAPDWCMKKLVVLNEIDKELVRRNSMQGIYYRS